jgi:PAS domain S-box-containing protein
MKETIFSIDSKDFKQLVMGSPVAIYTCDKNGYVTFYNEAAEKLWGRSPEIGVDLWCGSWKIYYPDGRPMPLDQCPMALTLKGNLFFNGEEIVIERPDNTFLNLLVFPRPLLNDAGESIGAYNTLVDISNQKTGEEKQAILSAIVESSDDAIISKNLNGIITSWNAGATKIFGYTEDEIIGKHISVLIPKQLQAEEEIIISNIKSGKKIDHFQTIRLHKSGKPIAISLTVSPVKDSRGIITGASKIARDITERLHAEKVIKETAERLEILNSIGKAISEKLDVQEILQKVIEATTNITGAAFGAFFYSTIDDQGEALILFALSGASREAFEQLGISQNTVVLQSAFSGEGVVRIDDIRKDPGYGKNALYSGLPVGYLPVVSYLAVPVISTSGKIIGGLFFGHPEQDIFKAEHEDMVVSIASQAAVALDNSILFEEVKALSAKKDEFIALASHELKTPLTTVKGYMQVLARNEKDSVSKLFTDKAISQVEKLDALINDLLNVSKIEAGKLQFQMEVFDMRALLHDVIETFEYNNTSHKMICNIPDEIILVQVDKQRIEQAMINIITNAIKYSPKADTVYISLGKTDTGITVKVRDEGMGLTEQQKRQVFSRFFRAEGMQSISGLGLGLYLTKEIIDRHHGVIGVNSKFGKGSEFYFTLPDLKQQE